MARIEELGDEPERKDVAPAPVVERPNGSAQTPRVEPARGFSPFRRISAGPLAFLLLLLVSVIHLGSLLLFARGFLLTRHTIPQLASCDASAEVCPAIEPTHRKAIVLLIDALRHDFILPHSSSPPDPFAHNHLPTPGRLTVEHPSRSLLFHAVADPPTTTLQRLKGITTGSLPTFIDASANFGSANMGIDEDSWVQQLARAGKVLGFAGDDTWTGLFGTSSFGGLFGPNLTFPFESFNVEDLDTVDRGVEESLLPLIEGRDRHWDVLIGHFLGLDHVGHRLGASHAKVAAKLQQYNAFVDRVVEAMDDDTLLVVLGDHGMDQKGDHGGDSFLEVSTALWLYSKTRPLRAERDELPEWAVADEDFIALEPSIGRHRSVQQISLVPTLSLLLGVPIPFSNLGHVIPELFFRSTLAPRAGGANPKRRQASALSAAETLVAAARANARQILRYLEVYAGGSDSPGQALAPSVPHLRSLMLAAEDAKGEAAAFHAYRSFVDETLARTRKIWARFDPVLMGLGIGNMMLSALTIIRLVDAAQWTTGGTGAPIRSLASMGWSAALMSAFAATTVSAVLGGFSQPWYVIGLGAFAVGGNVAIVVGPEVARVPRRALRALLRPTLSALPLLGHAASFAANSFILWEEKTTLGLLVALCVPVALKSFDAPQDRLRSRLVVFPVLVALCARLMSLSTLCREEQHPYCSVTFYASATASTASPRTIAAVIPSALALPVAVAWFLGFSDSYRGLASGFFGTGMRICLLLGCQYWISDYLAFATANSANPSNGTWVKTVVAQLDLWLCVAGGSILWYLLPLCLDVERDDSPVASGGKPKITVIGFANSYGSAYLMFFASCFCTLFLVTQPTGQLVLCLALVATLSLVEVNDSLHDAQAMKEAFAKAVARAKAGPNGGKAVEPSESRERVATPSLTTLSMLALLSFVVFFATGHQATFAAIQWKVAFVGFDSVTYPWSPLLVIVNTLGPFMLSALAVPLLVFWNFSPRLPPSGAAGPAARVPLTSELLKACLRFSLYHGVVTLSAMIWAAYFRRHLMVWKVFAPRFMLAGVTLVAVDCTLTCLSVGWGGLMTIAKVRRTFRTQSV